MTRGLLSGLLLTVLFARSALAQAPIFRFDEKHGAFSVGLKVVEQYDYSRVFLSATDDLGRSRQGERARPLQTLIWYPALHATSSPVTFADYTELWSTEITFGKPTVTQNEKEWRLALRPALATIMVAARDAPAADGSFPIVIYAPGAHDPAWENADLCEYLASHGYIVLASPSLGARTRRMTLDLEGIDAQARDISFLLGYARTLPNVNLTQAAVIGHSWGGLANVFAAWHDNRIRAVVSLDGSLRYFPSLLQAGGVNPEQMTIPILAFLQRNFAVEDVDRHMAAQDRSAPSALNAWTHGDLVTVHMLGLTHSSFNSLHQRSEDRWWELLHAEPMSQGDYGRDDGIVGYGWMARYTLIFLDAHLKNDFVALDFLKRPPTENGVPRHTMESTYRVASVIRPTFDAFRTAVGDRGVSHIDDIYAEFKAKMPAFELGDPELRDWADQLITDNHVPEAIAVLRLNVRTSPRSSSAYALLADAYATAGENRNACENYSRALELDPSNSAARRKLSRFRQC